MFLDILVPLVLGDLPDAAIRQACALAASGEGRVVGLVGVSLAAPIGTVWAYCPADAYATMHEAAKATVQELAEAAGRRLDREAVPHEIRALSQFWLTPPEMAALHGRYADLVVIGLGRPLLDPERRLAGSVMAGAGRPVLLVPATAARRDRFDRVLVAWKSSREAARAVHDAMPLLQRASAVEVLMVEEGHDFGTEVPEADTALESHLLRHGVRATVVRRAGSHAAASVVVLEHAREWGAQLIVAGGYSHHKALEQVFGGVTVHLLEMSPVPVLLSH